MRRTLIAVVTALFALAARAEAAELEGFGPIKFGMSKEAAFLAIGQQGEWGTSSLLTYNHPFDQGRRSFEVHQSFEEGQARDAAITYQSAKESAQTCLAMGLRFAGEIQLRYQVAPIVRFGLEGEFQEEEGPLYELDDIFVFVFDKGAFIRMIVEGAGPKVSCRITLLYHAPEPEPLPF